MPDPFGTKFNPFSSSFQQRLNEVGEYAIDWYNHGDDVKARTEETFIGLQPFGIEVFMAQLNDAAAITGQNNRFKYAWEAYVPEVAVSAKGFPGQGASATSDTSTWRPSIGQKSSMVGTDPYGAYAVNGAEVANHAVSTTGYISYGNKIGTGPSGSGTITMLAIGNLTGSGSDFRQVIVPMFKLPFIDPTRNSQNYWFSAGNDVEVSCS